MCSVVDRELAFRGNGGSSAAVIRPHCAEFVNVMKGRDLLENCLNSATVIWFHMAGSCFYFMKFAIMVIVECKKSICDWFFFFRRQLSNEAVLMTHVSGPRRAG